MLEHDILSKIYGYFINRWPEDMFRHVEIIRTYENRKSTYVIAIYYFSGGRTSIVYQLFLFGIEKNVRLVSSSIEHFVRAIIPNDIDCFDIAETIDYVPMKKIIFNIAEKRVIENFINRTDCLINLFSKEKYEHDKKEIYYMYGL